MQLRTSLLPALLAMGAPAAAQSFNYPDFSSIAGLALNNDAVQAGTALRVSGATISEKGSAYYDQLVQVAGGFDTTFTFEITSPASGGGDGMAFIIQNDPVAGLTALADHASALGYSGFLATPTNAIDNALAIEIDTYFGGSWGDPSANHISIHTGGTGDCNAHEDFSIGVVTPAIDMSDGSVHTMRVAYDGATLDVYLDDLVTPALSAAWNFATGGTYSIGGAAGGLNLQGGTSAYVGFTAAAGGAWENHDILSWSFTSGGGGSMSPACDPANNHSGGTYADLGTSSFSGPGVLHLEATNGPANEFGYFLVSGILNDPGNSVSNGMLCLGVPIGRYAPAAGGTLNSIGQFDAAGVLQNVSGNSTVGSGYDVLATLPSPPGGMIATGDTWYFQCWFRDGNRSNFSNVLAVTF